MPEHGRHIAGARQQAFDYPITDFITDTKMLQFRRKGAGLLTGMDQMTFRQARARRLLAVRELAARAGLAPATVYQIEHGRTRPHYRSIRLLSKVLGVEPMQIIEFAQVIEERGNEPAEMRTGSARRNCPPTGLSVRTEPKNTSTEQRP
jgi:transcriptional regulator with XRE-family HTH domain